MTKTINSLNTTDTYRLINKDSWLAEASENKNTLIDYPQVITGFTIEKVVGSAGYIDSTIILNYDEYEYFEIVNTTTSNNWNGSSSLEAGMLVAQGEIKLLGVNSLEENIVIVEQSGIITTYKEHEITHIKTEEELQFDKVLAFVKDTSDQSDRTFASMLIEGGFKL